MRYKPVNLSMMRCYAEKALEIHIWRTGKTLVVEISIEVRNTKNSRDLKRQKLRQLTLVDLCKACNAEQMFLFAAKTDNN